ncbi:hypothetical protein JCM3774_000803 [Rhodotorula dairenensis]
MSRHRAVKNLDLADELDDGAFDANDSYYEDMTSEQQAQMTEAFAQVQAVLGTDSPISDNQIRDALWDSYFDVDGTIAHLLDEQHKKEVRKQKEQGEATEDLSRPRSGSAHGGEGGRGGDNDTWARDAATPPTAALASLSLRGTQPSSSSAAATGAAGTPAPKNKLAAKMAANKAARAATATAADRGQQEGGSRSDPAGAGSASATAESTSAAATPMPPQEKKLSKLQQKMLAAKAAKAAAGSNTAHAADPASSPGISASAPAQGTAEARLRGVARPESEPEPVVVPDAFPIVLDGLPASASSHPAPAGTDHLVLSAAPSAFAAALAPSRPLKSSSWSSSSSSVADSFSATKPVLPSSEAARIASLAPALSIPRPALVGPSPDDKVLEARKGTALAGRTGRGARTGTGTGTGARRPVGVAVPGARR